MDPCTSVSGVWNTELYRLQITAPKPKPLLRSAENSIEKCPEFYNLEYWGNLRNKDTKSMMDDAEDGSYLVRKSPSSPDGYALSIKYDGRVRHFRVHYDPFMGHRFQGGEDHLRTYATLNEMVEDGLIYFHINKFGHSIVKKIATQEGVSYEESPYMTINKSKLLELAKTQSQIEIKGGRLVKKEANTSENIVVNEIKENPHKFKTHTFKGLNWCELCANFLWGFSAQGVKCENCGFQAHHKCSQSVPEKCVPDLKKMRGIFGADLTTMVSIHQDGIPFVVRICVKEIEERGLNQEGIYRVSGFADEIESLKLALDKNGETTDMSEKAYSNINVIAGILKLYLRLLPVPLITLHSHPALIEASNKATPYEQIASVKEALKTLPPAHFHCLKFIMEHLHRVAKHQNINKMTEHNLATVFAPTLIETPSNLTGLAQEIYLLTLLISNCNEMFV